MINFNTGEKPIETPTMPSDKESYTKTLDTVANIEKELEILSAREHIAEGSIENLISEIELEIQAITDLDPEGAEKTNNLARLEKSLAQAEGLLKK